MSTLQRQLIITEMKALGPGWAHRPQPVLDREPTHTCDDHRDHGVEVLGAVIDTQTGLVQMRIQGSGSIHPASQPASCDLRPTSASQPVDNRPTVGRRGSAAQYLDGSSRGENRPAAHHPPPTTPETSPASGTWRRAAPVHPLSASSTASTSARGGVSTTGSAKASSSTKRTPSTDAFLSRASTSHTTSRSNSGTRTGNPMA